MVVQAACRSRLMTCKQDGYVGVMFEVAKDTQFLSCHVVWISQGRDEQHSVLLLAS